MEKTLSGMPDELTQKNDAPRTETRSGSGTRRGNSRRRKSVRADAGRFLIVKLLGLVFLVLVVFEGNVIYRLFSHSVGRNVEIMNSRNDAQTEGLLHNSAGSDIAVSTIEDTSTAGENVSVVSLAGGGSVDDLIEPAESSSDTSSQQSPEALNSPKVVALRDTPVDDSFFHNAVFIGDSRMEGFRNSSGITQGTFLTGVGLSVEDMDKQIISTAEGKISVYQGLSGQQYDRIYLMLGANDLGYYPWDMFLPQFMSVLEQFHELQPGAIIYVCSVIYVDESKIGPGFEYNNNENVRTINGYILDACEDLWYSYYLNLNEIFSNGYGALISEASPDGIHLYPDYLEMMLYYLKTHYITDEEFAQEKVSHPDDIANALFETEAASKSGSGEGNDTVIVN